MRRARTSSARVKTRRHPCGLFGGTASALASARRRWRRRRGWWRCDFRRCDELKALTPWPPLPVRERGNSDGWLGCSHAEQPEGLTSFVSALNVGKREALCWARVVMGERTSYLLRSSSRSRAARRSCMARSVIGVTTRKQQRCRSVWTKAHN
jgi:hypothetical protein